MKTQAGYFNNKVLWIMISLSIHHVGNSQTVETLTSPFNAAGGVTVDKNGVVYVADFGNFLPTNGGTNVYKVFPDGSTSLFATGLVGASGNDFGPDGFLYQSNIGANKVSKIAPDGTVTTFATGIPAPVGIVVTKDTITYVTNCTNPGKIDMISPDGTVSTFVSSSLLNCPNGLTMDSLGNLYACNFGNGWVIKITPDKQVSNFVFIPGGAVTNGNNGHLTYSNNHLYVSARCANQIYKVDLNGTSTLFAGTGIRGNSDGPALNATFSVPNGIAASITGDTLYINDDVTVSGNCANTNLNPVVVRMIIGVNNPTDLKESNNNLPQEFQLEQNYPNPFNPNTKIRYSIITGGLVTLRVYDMLGKEIATLVDEDKTAGNYEVEFDGSLLTSGIYVYRLFTVDYLNSKKMILLK